MFYLDQEIEVKRNNEILGDKILCIFSESNKIKKKPIFEFKKNHSQTRKWEMYKIAQDNQVMLKRLVDQPSCYDKRSWIKDFDKSQGYKKNICVFPSIKFFKEQEKLDQFSNMKFSEDGGSSEYRSKTSYQKYKNNIYNENNYDKLYNKKYLQNSDEQRKITLFMCRL